MASRCPKCKSEYIFFSPRRQMMVCEDCGHSFEKPLEDHSKLHVFFSYGHDRNSVVVERLMSVLRERGHKVWVDRERIDVGSEWRRRITDGILESDGVVSFMSRHSVRKPGVCLDELRIALCVRNADVKTVLLESEREVDPPASLASRQWLDMSDWKEHFDAGGADWDAWFGSKADELVACLESPESVSFHGELEELRSVLQPLPYGNREFDLMQRDFFGRLWLLDRVQAWEESDGQRVFVLWGVPGSGKSSFASHLAHFDPSVAATVFFEYGRAELASFDSVTRLLSYQLASKLPDYRAQLLYVVRNRRTEVDYLHDESLFDLVVGNPLRNSVDGERATTVVVLDAADELAELNPVLLPRLLAKLYELPDWMRLLVTSRQDPGIEALFDGPAGVTLGLTGTDEADADIAGYLAPWVNDMATAQRLARSCEGSFLYAVMLREQLETGRLTADEALGLTGGLSAFYLLNFVRRFADRADYAAVRPALELIMGSSMLPRQFLCDALGYDSYDFLAFRRAIGSFVVLNSVELWPGPERKQVMGLVHKSLADWLADERLAGEFYVDARSGKVLLGEFFTRLIRDGGLEAYGLPEQFYVRRNTASLLVDGGRYDTYVDLLLDQGDPALPLWGRVRDLPAWMDVSPLTERLRETLANIDSHIHHSELHHGQRFAGCCEALMSCMGHSEFDGIFVDLLLSRNGLWCPTAFFCSGASDCYDHDGLPGMFNLDKICVAHALTRSLEMARSRGVHVPEQAIREVQLIKLTALYIEGAFDEDCAECAMTNLSHRYRDDLCELTLADIDALEGTPIDEDIGLRRTVTFYNTYCLYLYLRECEQVSVEVEKHVRRALAFGADFAKARELINSYLRRNRVANDIRLVVARDVNVRRVMEHLAAIFGPSHRRHPLPAVFVRGLGPLEDYCEVYEFPCCHKQVVTGDGAPSQIREDGCEVYDG